MKFGLLSYTNTFNLGDEIQSIAASLFLPSIDVYIDRENISLYEGAPVRLICNGWFMHQPQNWPPSANIEPIFTSLHLTDSVSRLNGYGKPPAHVLLAPENIGAFKAHEPIGARDLETLRLLRNHGIDAYFSGCLTTTLPRWLGQRSEMVCCVDIDDELFFSLQIHSGFALERTSHIEASNDRAFRFERAISLLRRYQSARLVITTRLHAALPCLAVGTPVIVIENSVDRRRISGFDNLLHIVSKERMLKGLRHWWSRDYEANKELHFEMRRQFYKRLPSLVYG